jgi:hypothetical protein
MPPARPLPMARLALVLAALAAVLVFTLSGPARRPAPPPPIAIPVKTWDGEMAEFLRKSGPKVTESQVTREVDRCRSDLAAQGVTLSRLDVLSGANALIPAHQPKGPHDTFKLYEGTFRYQIYTARMARVIAAQKAQHHTP